MSAQGPRLQGLVGARQRGGRPAWEIDYLVDATRGHEALSGLLECAIADAGRAGAEKLFLRLDSASPLLTVVLESGFMGYQESVLYTREGMLPPARVEGQRPVAAMDSYFLFRLYTSCLPEAVRRLEAATYNEWLAAQDRRWLRHGEQFVVEGEARLRALVSLAYRDDTLSVDLLAEDGTDAHDVLASAAAAMKLDYAAVEVLLPSTASRHAAQLQDAGFRLARTFISLMRRTTRPLAVPKLRPAIAETAVGV
jgi:hypothetical protein